MTGNGSYTAHLRDAVRRFYDRGFRPVPVGYRTKQPAGGDGWNRVTRDGFDLDTEFPPDRVLNVGVLNGRVSGGLTDVDLDCTETIRAGSVLLPKTGMVWGRRSAPTSHRGYISRSPIESAKFYDPIRDRTADGALLLEIRSDGGQSVLPPSVYGAEPDKGTPEEPSVWHLDGDPAEIDAADLLRAVSRTAAAALAARYWPNRARHDLSLAISGGLLRAGWPIEDVLSFLRAVCVAANDSETKDRLHAVESTFEKLEEGKKSTGWPTAAKLLGEKGPAVVEQVRGWLGVRIERVSPGTTPNGPRTGGPRTPGRPVRYVSLPAWTPFPVEHLPDPWRGFVAAAAEAVGADPSFSGRAAQVRCGRRAPGGRVPSPGPRSSRGAGRRPRSAPGRRAAGRVPRRSPT